jgi:hypothetical protein
VAAKETAHGDKASGREVIPCLDAPAHASADEHGEACAALAEARRRGWAIALTGGQPVVTAPLRSLSSALLDRLVQLADAVTDILEDERCR